MANEAEEGDTEVIGAIEFTARSILKPWEQDPECYVSDISGKIVNCTEHDKEVQVGEIKLELFNVSDALDAETPLAFVFDARSLDELWAKLFRDDEFATDLGIDATSLDVLYVGEINIEPTCQDPSVRVRAIQTAMSIFCPDGVTAAHYSLLTNSEWGQLGFKPLRKTEFVFGVSR